jgi:predicted amidohydrolase
MIKDHYFQCYLAGLLLFISGNALLWSQQEWRFHTPRTEVAPRHWEDQQIRYQDQSTLALAGAREGHDNGSWVKEIDLDGAYLQIGVLFQTKAVDDIPRSIIVNLVWKDGDGKQVGPKEFLRLLPGVAKGWRMFKQTYETPAKAKSFELWYTYRWDGDGQVNFAWPEIAYVAGMPDRKVRLATVYAKPVGSSPDKNRKLFADLAAQAGELGADIVCLPEGLSLVGTAENYASVAETIPGPTTEALSGIAREHQMYIVAGILEQDGPWVYNTAVLLDREGNVAGKYRKVSLPREEIEGGVSPGNSFPVFDTDFGKVGMMICWDVTFPEAARQLALEGAEVILMPIWGGNPQLARARAIENQVYIVSSTYDTPMQSGIFDLEGELLGVADVDDPVTVVEVDLNQQKLWPWLGELKNRIRQEMPPQESLK